MEQPPLILRRDANAGIFDFKAQPRQVAWLAIQGDTDRYFPLFGEFDGVARQVDEHLPHPVRIALQPGGDFRGDKGGQFDFFVHGPLAEQFGGAFHYFARIEIDFFKGQFTGLDFREIENVVDDRE